MLKYNLEFKTENIGHTMPPEKMNHCTDRIFKALIRSEILYFQENFQNLVVHDFTFLMTPFEFKLTHYFMTSRFFLHFLSPN